MKHLIYLGICLLVYKIKEKSGINLVFPNPATESHLESLV